MHMCPLSDDRSAVLGLLPDVPAATPSDRDTLLVLPEHPAQAVADLADGDVALHAFQDARDQVLAPAGGPLQAPERAFDRRPSRGAGSAASRRPGESCRLSLWAHGDRKRARGTCRPDP